MTMTGCAIAVFPTICLHAAVVQAGIPDTHTKPRLDVADITIWAAASTCAQVEAAILGGSQATRIFKAGALVKTDRLSTATPQPCSAWWRTMHSAQASALAMVIFPAGLRGTWPAQAAPVPAA